jgi:hypothetical protein
VRENKKLQVFLRGGLGNQLFQYAAGLFLAKKQDEEVIFRSDLLPKYPDSIGGVSRWPIQITHFKFEGRVSSKANQPLDSTNVFSKFMQAQRLWGDTLGSPMVRLGFLSGDRETNLDFTKLPRIRVVNSYCASSTPALELGDTLRAQLLEAKSPSKQYLDLISEFRRIAPVVVHLRLGDYRNLEHIFGRPNFDRLEQVIRRVLTSHGSPVWLLTDSPEELDTNLLKKLKIDRVFGPQEIPSPLENLILLSAGSTLICSNSTLSWWAAFLKGPEGQVLYPSFSGTVNEVFGEDMVLWGWEPYDAGR